MGRSLSIIFTSSTSVTVDVELGSEILFVVPLEVSSVIAALFRHLHGQMNTKVMLHVLLILKS